MAKAKGSLWVGFLEAGSKGGPVVRDDRLSTGNSSTIYLYSGNKERIVEYRRDIVETKLRELTPEEESELKTDLVARFETARAGFVPRKAVKRMAPVRQKEEEPDFDPDEDVIELEPAADDFDD